MSDEVTMKEEMITQVSYDPYAYNPRTGRRNEYNPVWDCDCDECARMYDTGQTPTTCECDECRTWFATNLEFQEGTLDELILALEDMRAKMISDTNYEEFAFKKFMIGYELYGKRPETAAEITARKKREVAKFKRKKKKLEKLQQELVELEASVGVEAVEDSA